MKSFLAAVFQLFISAAVADFECHINVCGCPSSYKQSWCTSENSLISSEWCNAETSNCENHCGGESCPTSTDDDMESAAVASISMYPGYAGSKTVAGTVVVSVQDDGIQMFGTVIGLEPYGTGGIHIHVGTSCATSDDPQGHYYEGMATDPWTTTYTSDATGAATVNFEVASFTLFEEYPTAGRTVVVHDVDGTRIGCGVIIPTEGEIVTIGTYPEYDGTIEGTGTLVVSNADSSSAGIRIMGTLTGLEPSVTGGLHVHSGYTCDDAADVGGHYYEGMATDPWTTSYTSDASGYASVDFNVADFTLASDYPVELRAMVTHASDGTRIGCGIISTNTAAEEVVGPSMECHISQCGCPGSYLMSWCSDSNSLITSDWCNAASDQCANCAGTYCTVA